MTADTGQVPDYWTEREEGEPLAVFTVRLAAGYLRRQASADLDRAASRIRLAAALNPRNTGGQDPHPRYGRADYDNGIDTWGAAEDDAEDDADDG